MDFKKGILPCSSDPIANLEDADEVSLRNICVCAEDYHPNLKVDWPDKVGQSILIESCNGGKKFKIKEQKDEEFEENLKSVQVEVNLEAERQTVMGWGGSFTDSFGYNLSQVSKPLSDLILASYFGENGLQYNMARVPMGGADFSTRGYTYDDSDEPDFELKNWSLTDEDYQLKIPYIKQAISLAEEAKNEVKLFASPWSAPKWMKDNNNLVGGSLIETDRAYKSWANYQVKFYKEYEKNGINFWGGSVQNEPSVSKQAHIFFNGMSYTANQMIKFVGDYLGPALEEAGYTKDKFKLIVGDESLGLVNMHLPWILCNDKVSKYVSGIAFHWYVSGNNFPVIPYEAIRDSYEPVKDRVEFVMMSEACTGTISYPKRLDLGSWERGEHYAMDIMQDFVYQTSSWIDWNMALDMNGGPNWKRNFVDSPILVDSQKNEFYMQPMYYVLSHFSRFFKEGSVVVDSLINKRNSYSKGHTGLVWSLAAINKTTNHLVVNILNISNDKTKVELNVVGQEDCEIKSVKKFVIDGRSINSFVLKL